MDNHFNMVNFGICRLPSRNSVDMNNTKSNTGYNDKIFYISNNTKSSIDVLGDVDVHNRSSIFSPNGENLYDVIMLQHQEYVSQQEYNNLKNFVSNGGILFLLTGNVFFMVK